MPLIYQRGTKTVASELAEMREFRRPARPEYFEVRDLNTKKPTPSPSLGDSTLSLPSTRFDSEIRPLTLPDGRPGRAVSLRFKPDFKVDESEGDPPATQHVFVLIVARDTLDLQKTLMNLRWLLLLVCVGATIVSAML